MTFQRLLIGACGSINIAHLPAYVMAIRRFVAAEVRVVMTQTAASILPPRTLAQFCEGGVHTDGWQQTEGGVSLHVGLTRWADGFVALPATANMLGKAAHGIGDDLVSSTILAFNGSVIFAPAMNGAMWSKPAVQRNVQTLLDDGHRIMPSEDAPEVGRPADSGAGVSPNVRSIVRYLTHDALEIIDRSEMG